MCDVFGLKGINKQDFDYCRQVQEMCFSTATLQQYILTTWCMKVDQANCSSSVKKHIMTVQKEQSKQGRID